MNQLFHSLVLFSFDIYFIITSNIQSMDCRRQLILIIVRLRQFIEMPLHSTLLPKVRLVSFLISVTNVSFGLALSYWIQPSSSETLNRPCSGLLRCSQGE